MILDDADHPVVERGRYFIGYIEMVDGYRHAYEAPVGKYGHRTVVRYSRTANHPPDPRCPECNPTIAPERDPMTRPERLMWALGEVIAVPLIAAVELVGWAADGARTRFSRVTADDE